MNYKLRFYYITGSKKGNLKHEEFFKTEEDLKQRYKQVFEYNLFALNPTAWKLEENGDPSNPYEWNRLMGY
jgi:hypothetical protein